MIVVLGLNAAGNFGSDNYKLLITLTEVVCCVGDSFSELQGKDGFTSNCFPLEDLHLLSRRYDLTYTKGVAT